MIRFLVYLAIAIGIVYFATTVPLGKKTLWQHLRAIFSTREAKELADSVEEEGKRVRDRLRDRPTPDGGTARHTRPPLDPVDEKEQRDLDKLVKDKTKRR